MEKGTSKFLNKQDVIKALNGKRIVVKKLDEFILAMMDSVKMPGLSIAIINNAEIAYHRAFGVKNINTLEKVDEQTLFESGSLSKPLFAYFVMKHVEKGILDLDKPLFEYLPYQDIAYDDRYKLITARMVLCHTSGFPNWRFDIRLFDNWRNEPIWTKYKLGIKFTPGTAFQYSGEGYQYLVKVVARLRGTNSRGLDDIFQNEVAEPLGAQQLYYIWNDYIAQHKATGHRDGKATDNEPCGDPNIFGAAYSLYTEATNYAKFLIAMMQVRGIAKETWDEMLKEHVNLPVDHEFRKNGITGWSLGFAIEPTSNGVRYVHSGDNGDFQSYCHFYRGKDYGIAFFSNSDKIHTTQFTQKLNMFLEE
jgi:CubicO group peptidase (beta-lactamase class C family)